MIDDIQDGDSVGSMAGKANKTFAMINGHNLELLNPYCDLLANCVFTRASNANHYDQYDQITPSAIDQKRFNGRSLVLEPASTNELTNSRDFSGGDWFSSGFGSADTPTITNSTEPGVNPTTTVQLISMDLNGGVTAGDFCVLQQLIPSVSVGIISFYAKSATNENCQISFYDGGALIAITITPDWQRFSFASPAISATVSIRLYGHLSSGTANFYIDYMQYEQMPHATSAIGTDATATTRVADSCSMPVYNKIPPLNKPHSFHVKVKLNHNSTGDNCLISAPVLINGVFSDDEYKLYVDSAGDVIYQYSKSATLVTATAQNVDLTKTHEYTCVFDGSNISLYVDGVLAATQATAETQKIDTSSSLFIGSRRALVDFAACEVSQALSYDYALNAAQAELICGGV